jgi:uncharacterized protein (DUF433 family)
VVVIGRRACPCCHGERPNPGRDPDALSVSSAKRLVCRLVSSVPEATVDNMTGSNEDGRITLIDDPHYTAPLYRKAEAARIVRVPARTLREWAAGEPEPLRSLKARQFTMAIRIGARLDNPPALITTVQPVTPRGPNIPFLGLAEAFVLSVFRSAGMSTERMRIAVAWLQEGSDLTQVLATELFKTRGAQVLWDYGRREQDIELVRDLVTIKDDLPVFRPVISDYLRRITYANGWARAINIGNDMIDVTVDPWINGGQPTLSRRGVAVQDVLSRIRAGESSNEVAADYGLRSAEVAALLELAA